MESGFSTTKRNKGTKMTTETNHALQNAIGWMASIEEMLFAADEANWNRLEELQGCDEDELTIDERRNSTSC
jgi:hypothetical protein